MTGEVSLDLSKHEQKEGDDRRALWCLGDVPSGAVAKINLGSRAWLTDDTLALLREHGARLQIVLIGDNPHTVSKIIRAVRG